MYYTVKNNRNGFEVLLHFAEYEAALDFYKDECADIGGPVILSRWDEEGNLDAVLHNTRG